MRILAAAAFVMLSALDIVTTHVALSRGAVESNPLAVMVLGHGGEPLLYAIKVAVVAAIVMVGLYRGLTPFLWGICGLMLLVVLNNLSHV